MKDLKVATFGMKITTHKKKTKNERSKGCNFWDENNNPQKKNT